MESTKKTHPLIITAAAAVVITCGVAVASMTGLIGKTQAETSAEVSPNSPATAPAPVQHSAAVKHSQPVQVAVNKPTAVEQPKAAVCKDCGYVSDVRVYEKKGEGSGMGAVAGGIAGALLGRQTGQGNGKTAMTVLGAAGGAYAGNAIEKNVKATKVAEVTVRFNDNTSRVFTYEGNSRFNEGDKVKVVNGELVFN